MASCTTSPLHYPRLALLQPHRFERPLLSLRPPIQRFSKGANILSPGSPVKQAGKRSPGPARQKDKSARAEVTMVHISGDFSPVPSLVGGLLLGLATSLNLALNGRITGASGIIRGEAKHVFTGSTA